MIQSQGFGRRSVFTFAFAAWTSCAFAGPAYKCVQPDGKIVFTDKKCDAQATPVKIWDSNLGGSEYPVTFSGAEPSELAPTDHPRGQSGGRGGDMLAKCASKWPGDYRMQEFCLQQQEAAAKDVTATLAGADASTRAIVGECGARWKDGDSYDFRMVKFCTDQQKNARDRLQGGGK
jgi:hypothetical protein